MVRPQQLLHPQREPANPRPAATVLLLRDSAQGIEVLMTRRSLTASFAPGAYVFPGGGIDALDAASHAQALRRQRHDGGDGAEADDGRMPPEGLAVEGPVEVGRRPVRGVQLFCWSG